LDIGVGRKSTEDDARKTDEFVQPPLNKTQLGKIKLLFKNVQFLLLDELSTIPAQMLALIDERYTRHMMSTHCELVPSRVYWTAGVNKRRVLIYHLEDCRWCASGIWGR
jgi:hypothetical protein